MVKDSTFRSDISSLAKGTGLAGFGLALQKVTLFVILAVQVKYMGIEKYGAYAISLGIMMLLTIPQCLGLPNGISRFAVKARVAKDTQYFWAVTWCGIVLPIITGAIIVISFYALSDTINNRFYQSENVLNAIKAFLLAMPLLGPCQIPAILTTSFETNRYAVLSRDIISPTIEVLLLLTVFIFPHLSLFHEPIFTVVFIRTTGQVAGAISGLFFLRKLTKVKGMASNGGIFGGLVVLYKNFGKLKEMIAYCLPLMMGGAFQRIVQWTDTIMVGAFMGTVSAGVYRVAVQISSALVSVLHAVGSIFSPIIARYYHNGQQEMIASLYYQATRWTMAGVLPFVLVLLVFPESFLSLFSAQAVIAIWALRVLVIGQSFNSFTGNVGIILTMTNKPYWHAINGIIVAVSHVVFCLLFIPHFGMVGAAISSAFAVILLNSLRTFETKTFFGFHCFSWVVLETFLPAFFAGLGLIAAKLILSGCFENNIIAVLLSLFISCTLSWGIHVLFFLSEEDKYFLVTIKSKLKTFIR